MITADDTVIIRVPDTRYVTDPKKDVNDVVSRTYNDAFLTALPIVTYAPGGDPVVELGGPLLAPLVNLPAPSGPFAAFSPRRDMSTFDKVKVFPDNVLIDADIALAGRSGAGMSVGFAESSSLRQRFNSAIVLPSCKRKMSTSCIDGPGVSIRITRNHDVVFEGETTLSQMRRKPEELVEYLYREMSFPSGCILLTGTGIIPPDEFTLQAADLVEITIEPIGTLSNVVE